jgi:integrase/recombinase XerD
MVDYIDGIDLRGRDRTAVTVATALCQYQRWLHAQAIDPLRVTSAQVAAYQHHLLTAYRTPGGEPLARLTAGCRIGCIKQWYRWLTERDHLVSDPARRLGVRVVQSRVVRAQRLTLQEATALVQTQAARVAAQPAGSYRRAQEMQALAAVCLTLATGRRISGIQGANVSQIDLERRELRVDHEKGQVGRVLPVAGWAIDTVRWHLAEARPRLVQERTPPWLFVGRDGGPLSAEGLRGMLRRLIAATIATNPDLTELPAKRIAWHSLRVSFATLLFQNGCDIRSVNELMLHRKLSTTAAYTPVPVEDLRQVFRRAHPRA